MKGFTLLESVLFLAILAVALAGIFSIHQVVLVQSVRPVKLAQAALLAQAKMEEILSDRRISGYSVVTDTRYPAEPPFASVSSSDPLIQRMLANYTRSVRVVDGQKNDLDFSCLATYGSANLRCITVSVHDTVSLESLAVLQTMIAGGP